MTAASLDIERYWSTIEASAAIGVGRPGGLSRLALGDADRDMRDLFVSWCKDAGMAVRVDGIGNVFARRPGQDDSLPPVVVGSHFDTQVNGGRFDGIAGVLAGLEICRALDAAGHATRRPIEVVDWTNEEGGRFSPPAIGSSCFVGTHALDWAYARPADDGTTIGAELDRIGYRGTAPMGQPFDSYFEFHIEQGPILEREGMQVGVVTGGYTSHGMVVEYGGETAHTGPWPMDRRRNALVAGARLLVAVDEIGRTAALTGGKATASRLVAWPNKSGILSDWAQVTCDTRHEHVDAAEAMAEWMRRAAFEAGARADCDTRIVDRWSWGGDLFDPDLVALVRQTSLDLGYRTRDIRSQAGHDAYHLAGHCPAAMIFTPCKDGITHNNNEDCSRDDLAPGLDVLLRCVLDRADR